MWFGGWDSCQSTTRWFNGPLYRLLVLVVSVSFSDCLNSVLVCWTNNLSAERARLFCPPPSPEFLCPLSNTFPLAFVPQPWAWNPRLVGRVELGTSATPQKSQLCALGLGFLNHRVVLLHTSTVAISYSSSYSYYYCIYPSTRSSS
jgi:hypothetical protein